MNSVEVESESETVTISFRITKLNEFLPPFAYRYHPVKNKRNIFVFVSN